jgi:hypothetical protein
MFEDMQQRGVIEESDSPSSSPALVRKKNGDLHFCIDCRKLTMSQGKTFTLPRIENTLDTLGGAKWFFTADLKSGYWQVDLHSDKEKTAFSTVQCL